jgi:hypothetical protein
MTKEPEQTPEVIETAQLEHVIGGAGIGSMIGGLFGAEGAKWGGFADGIIGQIGGMLGQGGGGGGG